MVFGMVFGMVGLRRVLGLWSVVGVLACSGDSSGVAASTTLTTSSGGSTTGEPGSTGEPGTGSGSGDTGAPTLTVDCGMPPMGAVGATYDHTPTASGVAGAFSWSAVGLPMGMNIDPITGALGGTPQQEGMFDIDVTASGGSPPQMATATCSITVGAALSVDLSGLPGPCVDATQNLLDQVSGGDGSPVVCSTPGGTGMGSVPAGISVNPDTCAIEGSITETDYGTWVWMTRVQQSDAAIFVPYCVTQATQPPNSYTITGTHGGGDHLTPASGTFMPGQPIAWGGGMDPVIQVEGPCAPATCFWGFTFAVPATPFDSFSLDPSMLVRDMSNAPIGFSHELSATGPAVPAEFESRPWVLNWRLTYCVAPDGAACATIADIQANSAGNLRFGVIMSPG